MLTNAEYLRKQEQQRFIDEFNKSFVQYMVVLRLDTGERCQALYPAYYSNIWKEAYLAVSPHGGLVPLEQIQPVEPTPESAIPKNYLTLNPYERCEKCRQMWGMHSKNLDYVDSKGLAIFRRTCDGFLFKVKADD